MRCKDCEGVKMVQIVLLVFLGLVGGQLAVSQNASNSDQFNLNKDGISPKGVSERNLDSYYKNRKIISGPPIVPHDIKDTFNLKMNRCLSCHLEGSFSPNLGKYAPKTPHPEFSHCNQCHLPQKTNSLFKENNVASYSFKRIGALLALGPPRIPHDFQNRSNCVSCHAGPSAPKEIRTDHPDRIHCRQCHMPATHKDEKESVLDKLK